MSINLYYSNHLSELFRYLLVNLRSDYQNFSYPFEADKIIVLNQHIQKWLQIEIANKNKIAANIDFLYLESTLWGYLRDLDPMSRDIELLDKDKLQLILFEVLSHHQSKYMAVFERYILTNTKATFQKKKRWGLSEKLASLLLEYEYQRPELIEKWLKADLTNLNFDEQENAQCYLYCFLLHPVKGMLSKLKRPYSTLYQYSKQISLSKIELKNSAQKATHLFAISQISVFHQSLLQQLESHYNFHIYAFNPCAEFWEDVKSKSEDTWLKKNNFQDNLIIDSLEEETGEVSYEIADSPFLKYWGKTGREYIKLMSRMVNYDFCTSYLSYLDENQEGPLLQKIQQDIVLRNDPALKENPWEQDLSLQVFKAPSIYREVQTVYQHILHSLNKEDLTVHDIVVLVTDLDQYLPYIHSVFDGDQRNIPYCILGNSATNDSTWGQGILSILSLGLGRFNREDVFHCLENTCMMEKFQYGESDLDQWLRWVEDLGIHHHFDGKTRKEDGFDGSNFYTWQQGLQRLRMGLFFNKENDAVYPEFIPYAINSSDADSLDKFIYVLEKLNAINVKSQSWFSSQEWVAHIKDVNREMLAIPLGDKAENKYAASFLESLESILIFDEMADQLNEKNQLDLEIIISILQGNMDEISSVKGSFLISGITISEVQAMRVFPFKKTYMLGLDSKTFPGKDTITPLDLRMLQRKIGDISVPEKNRYLFLEKLMTTDQLILSWVYKDLVKDEIFEPATVIQQLIESIEGRLVTGQEFEVIELPLWNWDTAKSANSSISDLFSVYNKMDENRSLIMANEKSIDELKSESVNDDRSSFDYAIKPLVKNDHAHEYLLTVGDLNKYLKNPAYAEMEYKLGVKESEYDEDNLLEDNLESILLNNLEVFSLKEKILRSYLSKCYSAKTHFDFKKEVAFFLKHELKSLQLKNKTINGSYFKYLESHLTKELHGFEKPLGDVVAEILESEFFYVDVVYGADHQNRKIDMKKMLIKPAMKISLEKQQFLLRGSIPIVWKNDSALCHFQNCVESKYHGGKFKSALMLMYMVAYGDHDSLKDINRLKIHFTDKVVSLSVTKPEIKSYCDQLLNDFSGDNAALFPISSVTSAIKNFIKKGSLDVESIADTVATFKRKSEFDEYTNLIDYCRIGDFQIPTDISELINRRFALLFSFKEEKNK